MLSPAFTSVGIGRHAVSVAPITKRTKHRIERSLLSGILDRLIDQYDSIVDLLEDEDDLVIELDFLLFYSNGRRKLNCSSNRR